MKILIIGGSGLLGTHTAAAALARGHTVTSLARGKTAALPPSSSGLEYRTGDATAMSDAELQEAVTGHAAVVYALGLDDREIHRRPAYREFFADHVTNCLRILRAAQAGGARKFVVLGSYFTHFDAIFPEMGLARKHAYIKSRCDQRDAVLAAAGPDFATFVLELPYIIGSLPGRVPPWTFLFGMLDTKAPAALFFRQYASLTMPLETRQYVPKLQALKNIIDNPAAFGIELEPIPNQVYFASVTRTRDIDVRLAAKLAEMPVEEFIALNPGFSRPMIRADLTPRIVLPADRVEIFHDNLIKYDDKSLVSWQTYQPKKGDTLDAIAKKFGVSLAQLKEVNGITPRARAMPATMVVPMGSSGGARDLGRLPIMYAPPIAVSGPRILSHTVKTGETLPGIAGRYRVSVADLRRWNKIGRLTVGQKLTIQTRAAPVRAKASAKGVKGKSKKQAAGRIVRKTGS